MNVYDRRANVSNPDLKGQKLKERFHRALVIYNPVAGGRRRRRLEVVLDRLEIIGCRYELRRTERRGDAEEAARTAAEYGYDLVIVAGGDGTINEVANGLARAERALPLAVIPLGTANVLAAEMGLSKNPISFTRMLAQGRRKTIRLGWTGERYFMLMASVGLDAMVVGGVDPALKRRLGRLAYFVETLRQILIYRFPELSATVDEKRYDARMIIASRARHYGGAFKLAPAADLGGELLHVVLLRRGGVFALLRFAWALLGGRLALLADVDVVSGKRVTLDGPLGAPAQADGDVIGKTPLTLSVSERTIELVIP